MTYYELDHLRKHNLYKFYLGGLSVVFEVYAPSKEGAIQMARINKINQWEFITETKLV